MRFAHILPFVAFTGATLTNRAAPASWTFQGCYLDDVNNRTLSHSSGQDYSDQTVETCTTYCAANDFTWAGLEYGSECYCDFATNGAPQEPLTDCSMPCAGNSSEVCGNANRISIYFNSNAGTGPTTNPGPSGWTFLNCYTDSVNARTLSTSQAVSGSSGLTVAECTAACQAEGYTLAGVENGDECYCDTSIRNSATITSSGCDKPCTGNSSEFCGGANRLDIYQVLSAAAPSAAPIQPPAGWTQLGCYTDNGNARTLGTQQEVPGGYTNMTVENCLGVCTNLGYVYGGVEYSQECYCGNAILNGAACASDPTTCYQPCRGNTAEVCGGPSRLNVYYSGSSASVTTCSTAATSSSTSLASQSSLSTTSSSISSSSASLSSSSPSTSSSSSTVLSSSPSTSSGTASSTSSGTASSSLTSSTSSAPPPGTTASSTSSSSSSKTSSSTSTSTSPAGTACPSFWTSVVADLASGMRDSNGQCTDFARASIRYAFHDSAAFSKSLPFYAPAAGGCDGSLLLSPTEINRTENAGLNAYHDQLTQKFASYKAAGYPIGGADLIQVAAALGVMACPGGRIGRVYVGRVDTTTEAPTGLLPEAFGAGSDHDTILALFTDKGFSARDLAALIGAHSTSKANFETANGIPAGTPQDDTPGLWDVKYYNETINPPSGIGRFQSDINLSNASTTVGKQFATFVGAQAAWGASFSSAFQTLSTLGLPTTVRRALTQDCTSLIVNTFPAQ